MIIRRYIKKVGPISIKGQDLRVLDLSRLGEVEDVVNGMSPELQGCDMTATLPAQDLVSSRALGLRQVQTSGTKLPGCGVWEPVNEEPGCSLHQAHGLGERESEQMENVRCLDQGEKHLDPSSGAEADLWPWVGSPEKAELGLLEEWEEGPLGSWLIASPPLPAMEMVF